PSDRLAAAVDHGVLHQAADALPAAAVVAGDDVDAHDLHQLTVQLLGGDDRVAQVNDRGDAAGARLLCLGVDHRDGVIGLVALHAQSDEVLGLFGRVADDADADRGLGRLHGLRLRTELGATAQE